MYSKNKMSWWLYVVGFTIVLGSHLYMLLSGLAPDQMMAHAILNIFAAGILAAGWLSRKS